MYISCLLFFVNMHIIWNCFWKILSLLGFGRDFKAVLGYPIGLLMSCLAEVPLLMLENHPWKCSAASIESKAGYRSSQTQASLTTSHSANSERQVWCLEHPQKAVCVLVLSVLINQSQPVTCPRVRGVRGKTRERRFSPCGTLGRESDKDFKSVSGCWHEL